MNHQTPQPGSYVPRPRPSIAGDADSVQAEIQDFDHGIQRFVDGRVPEAVFLENRLRHGVYGQRQDGVHMMRSKLPLGLLSPEQLEAFADITEQYASGVAHLTTRQDIQVHFIALKRSPAVMEALARAEMTSREACGNVVRNITASPLAGVHPEEAFDVTPYGMALAKYLLRHPAGQSLGRKFKMTLTGSADRRFDTNALHDIGARAVIRDGVRGFHVVVGGGLGAVPHEAEVYTEFLPADELLPFTRAVLKVFGKHGEKKRRARARLKFLVAAWGIETFREAVEAAREEIRASPDWEGFPIDTLTWQDRPLHPPGPLEPPHDESLATWLRTATTVQRQPGYRAVRVRVPRGDLTPHQLRGLAEILRAHAGDTLRIGVDQSLWIRWVPTDRLTSLHTALDELGLAQARPGGLGDTVTCPGADTCKLGITSPRSLARAIQPTLDRLAQDPRLEHLRIHVSGCPNSCAHHHVADIGLFGAAKTVDGVTAPHFMLLLGGLAGGTHHETRGDGFGTTIIKLPAAHIGQTVERLTQDYLQHRQGEEAFGLYARRLGRRHFQALLRDLTKLPPPSEAPHLYLEHGQTKAFRVVRGTGECAGAVVVQGDLLLMDADRAADQATTQLEEGQPALVVAETTRQAFRLAARAILTTVGLEEVSDQEIEPLFRNQIYEPGRIYEAVGHYFLQAHAEDPGTISNERLQRLVVEASLFVEEAHSILARIQNPAGVPS